MINNLGDTTCISVKSIIPCEYIYPFQKKFGIQIANTCVGISREQLFFGFPSSPQNLYMLALCEVVKGKYAVCGDIIDENGSAISSSITGVYEVQGDFPDDQLIILNLQFIFSNTIFPRPGPYFVRIFANNYIVHCYDFPVFGVNRPEYPSEAIQNILDDPNTIKRSTVDVKCECSCLKRFSISLDPKDQIDSERLPEGNTYKCEECGKDRDITEVKANMIFYLGSKNIIDTINTNLQESRILSKCGFFNSALIIQVSAFEAFMRDTFVSRYENWFMYLLENQSSGQNAKKKIIKIVKDLGLKDQFFEQLLLFDKRDSQSGKDEIIYYDNILKLLLFGSDESDQYKMSRISFQQLEKSLGTFWAYKHFFAIDIKIELEKQKDGYYNHLISSFSLRHKIIHAPSKIIKYEVTPEMLGKNEKIILFIRNLLNDKLIRLKKEHR